VPTYDYECDACKKRMEIFHSITETRKKCPECGALKLRKQLGAGGGFLFRGSGFYATDYRSSDYTSKAKAETAGPPSSSKEPAKSSDSAGEKPSKKKEPAKAT